MNGVNGVTVAKVRARLSPEVNAKYKDYQIDRWIRHKAGDEEAVLRTIGNQKINEDRMRDILRDPDRPGGPLDLLNLNFTVFVAVPGAQQFFAFTQCAKEPKVAPEVFTQIVLVTNYYMLGRLEELFGDGATVETIQDQRKQPFNVGDMKGRTQIVGEIGGRSFPFMVSRVNIVNDWGGWTKTSVNALLSMKKPSGTTTTLCSDQELLDTYDRQWLPTYLGGQLDIEAHAAGGCGNMIKAWFYGGGLRRLGFVEGLQASVPPPVPAAPPTLRPRAETRRNSAPPPGAAAGPASFPPDVFAVPLPLPPTARPVVRRTKDVATHLGVLAAVLLFLLVRSVEDVVLLCAGAGAALYAQRQLWPRRQTPGGGDEALRALLVRRAAEACEERLQSRLGEVDLQDRAAAARYVDQMWTRLSPGDAAFLTGWVRDVQAVWPAEVAGPQHAAAYQRWLAVYRWLQVATPAVAAAADAEPRTR
eukprot:EG_transcript_10511